MPFNVLEYLRPKKTAVAAAINGLAEQLHQGASITPDEILKRLAASGTTERDLQAEIDRLDRVATLRAKVAAGAPAQKRLDVIDAEITAAAEKLQTAALAVQAVQDKHYTEGNQLREKLSAAEQARALILEPQNIRPADLEQLRMMQANHLKLGQDHVDARKQLATAQERMAQCEIERPKAHDLAKQLRNTPSAQEDAARWDRAQEARTKQLADAVAAMKAAEVALAESERQTDSFREALITGAAR